MFAALLKAITLSFVILWKCATHCFFPIRDKTLDYDYEFLLYIFEYK